MLHKLRKPGFRLEGVWETQPFTHQKSLTQKGQGIWGFDLIGVQLSDR
ncbi:MAG: hypothetical protein WCA35_22370 [Kovacikia sp.]